MFHTSMRPASVSSMWLQAMVPLSGKWVRLAPGLILIACWPGRDVDRMGEGPAKTQVGDGDVGGGDRDDLGGLVVAVKDHRVTVAARRPQRHARRVHPQIDSVEFVGAVCDQDRVTGSGRFDGVFQLFDRGDVDCGAAGRR
jgi:hypothetical protein